MSAQVAVGHPVVAGTPKWGFAEWFVISQTALPALLYLPGSQAFRLPIRVSAFAISLAALAWWLFESKSRLAQPKAQGWIAAVMALLTLSLFHPETPTLLGGLAHIGVYLAVIAPLFWAPAFVRTPEQLARLFWLLLICCGINSVIGVLQVYDPQRWLPAEFSRIVTGGAAGLGPVSYVGSHGERIIRPPGLFDTPGAVAGPGMSAALIGLIFAVSAIPWWKRGLSLALSLAGLAAIYLSQVRISLVLTVGMMGAYLLIMSRQGRLARATSFGALAGGLIAGSFLLAVTLGGASIQERVMTLFGHDPLTVYQNARGVQLDLTFGSLLTEHPLGAGLGRWGMPAAYFGSTARGASLWAEIQFTGWMIDGGVLMVALYCGALVVTAYTQWRVAMDRRYARLAVCAGVVAAVNLGTAALVFSFTPFVTQLGVQYWFLAGALHGVALSHGQSGA